MLGYRVYDREESCVAPRFWSTGGLAVAFAEMGTTEEETI